MRGICPLPVGQCIPSSAQRRASFLCSTASSGKESALCVALFHVFVTKNPPCSVRRNPVLQNRRGGFWGDRVARHEIIGWKIG